MDAAFFDSDDFYWQPTDPPYRAARDVAERQQLIVNAISTNDRWVVAGSMCGWGDVIIPQIELAIFVTTPTNLRIQRLRQRERARFGDRIIPGGDMHEAHEAFIRWATEYDTGTPDMRSRPMHEAWIAALPRAVMRVDGSRSIEALVDNLRERVVSRDSRFDQ